MATDKTPTKPPSTEAQQVINSTPNTVGGGTKGLSGLKPGTPIKTGPSTYTKSSAEYVVGAGAIKFSTLAPQERAQLLLRMGQIPNLYASGMAPTTDYINRQLKVGYVTPRAEDYSAYEKILAISDLAGEQPDNVIIKFANNPRLSEQFFGKISTPPKAVTPLSQLQADMDSKFLDLFDSKADSGLVKAYAKEINTLELSKAGISDQQKEDILLKYVQKKADNVYSIGGTAATDKGALGRSVRILRSAYADNGIPIDDKQIYNKAVQSLRSPDAAKNILEDINMHASIIMPAFKDFYAKGKSARDVLTPYIRIRSQILGIPEDLIRIEDMYEVGSGAVPLTVQEYKGAMYRSKDYKDSDNYKNVTLGDTTAMLRAFNLGA
jgi:hypothetical protein